MSGIPCKDGTAYGVAGVRVVSCMDGLGAKGGVKIENPQSFVRINSTRTTKPNLNTCRAAIPETLNDCLPACLSVCSQLPASHFLPWSRSSGT